MLRPIHTIIPYGIGLTLVSCACAFFLSNSSPIQYYPEETNVTLGSIKVTDYNKKIKLKPVTRSEFKRKMRETSNQYDLLRIFFDRTDLPEDVVDDLIDAGNFEPERRLKARGSSKVARVKDPDIQVHGDIKILMDDYDDEPFQLDGIDDVYDYLDELEEHPMAECRLPQPEILRVATNGESGKIYYPECVIVHRCRNVSGCCQEETQYCGPKSISIFRRPFLVLESLKGREDLVQPNKQMVEYRMLINHTECECKESRKPKGCDKLCPVPYAKLRSDGECTCGCRQDSARCKDIEAGFESLQISQLVCIKESRCQMPKCKTGNFDIRSGFCPMTFEADFFPRHNYNYHSRKATPQSRLSESKKSRRHKQTIGRTRVLSYNRPNSYSRTFSSKIHSRTMKKNSPSKGIHKSRQSDQNVYP